MRTKLSKIMLLSGVAAFAALAVVPSGGWLVRSQMRVLTGAEVPGAEELGPAVGNALNAREQAIAAAHSADYHLQLARALRAQEIAASDHAADKTTGSKPADDDLKIPRLLSILPLRQRFSDNPEMQADTLRYLCLGDFRIGRIEESALLPPKKAQEAGDKARNAFVASMPPQSSAVAISLAEDAATRGEALDPRNAFFPTMLAAAFLAQHKDDDAFAALARAAEKPGWNDYAADEARARTELLVAANGGEPGGIARVSIAAAIPLPHFAQIRDEARVVTALATQHEISGDREGGFEIRRAMGRVGATMRAQPQCMIGSLCGAAITTITSERPGGSPPMDQSVTDDDNARAAALESRYVGYLTQIGHPEEAAWFVGERANGQTVRQLSAQSMWCLDDAIRPYINLSGWWVVCLYLLSALGLTLAGGGLAAFLSRSTSVRTGLPLHRGIKLGLFFVAQVPIFYVFGKFLFGDAGIGSVGYQIALIDAIAFGTVLLMLKRRHTWREVGSDVFAGLLTFITTLGILALAAWLGACIDEPLGVLKGLSGIVNDSDAFTGSSSQALLGAATCLLPGLTALILAIQSKNRKIPVSVGIVRGFRATAIPVASLLMLLYGIAAGGTLVQESIAREDVNHELTDEGAYCASKIGAEWPGPTAAIAKSSDIGTHQ